MVCRDTISRLQTEDIAAPSLFCRQSQIPEHRFGTSIIVIGIVERLGAFYLLGSIGREEKWREQESINPTSQLHHISHLASAIINRRSINFATT
jgi:hypothetical protein